MATNPQQLLLDNFWSTAGAQLSRWRAGTLGGSSVASLFRSGLGLAGLIGGLFGLFDGADAEQTPRLTKYPMPKSLSFEAAETRGGLTDVDYDQRGMARAFGVPGRELASDHPDPEAYASHITINVQAMDSRSFLDRSTDIAAAVRNAMLNLNSINDVVSGL